jgi:hypothetical protein
MNIPNNSIYENIGSELYSNSSSIGDISDYNPFVFEFISTPEYVLFTCTFDRNFENKISDTTVLLPIDFSNNNIKSMIEIKTINKDLYNIYESNIIYNQLVNKQALGEIHFDATYSKPGKYGSIECYTVSNATGMFEGITKVIKDFTQPIVTLYFVKSLDYF